MQKNKNIEFPTKKQKSNGTIFWVAACIVFFANAIIIAAVYFSLEKIYRQKVLETEVRSQNLSLAIEIALASEVGKIDLSLRTVIAELQSQNMGLGDSSGPLKSMLAHQRLLLPEIEAWSIVNSQGRFVFRDSATGSAHFSVADRDYFKAFELDSKDRLLVSKPIYSRSSDELVIPFVRGIRDKNGIFGGVAIVLLPASYFDRILRDFDIGRHGALTLRLQSLDVIARIITDDLGAASVFRDAVISPEFSSILSSGKIQGTYHGRNPFDNIERISTFRKLGNAPFYTVVSLSKWDQLSEWKTIALRASVFLAIFLLVADGSAWLIYRFWERQQRDKALLEERDKALVFAQEAGQLGTYSVEIETGRWILAKELQAIFGTKGGAILNAIDWENLLHPEDREKVLEYFREEVLGKYKDFDWEYRVVRPYDGRTIWVHGLGRMERSDDGQALRMLGTIQDISNRKFSEQRLRLTDQVFQNATEAILVTNADGEIIETNPAFSNITGFSADEVKGQRLEFLNSGAQGNEFYLKQQEHLRYHGCWEGELINRRKNGSRYVEYSRLAAIRDPSGKITNYCAVSSDITKVKDLQQQLERVAYYDDLTGLPNRVLLADRIRQAITLCKRKSDALVVVCTLDIDEFQEVNKRLGHDAGNRLLAEVAKELRTSVRSDDTVARLGGDEFAIIFNELKSVIGVENAVLRLIECVSKTYQIDDTIIDVTVSVGITIYPQDGSDEPDVLIRHADYAMFEAKRNGKNRMQSFNPESDRLLKAHKKEHKRLVEALVNEEFRLHYQPKVNLRTGAVLGVEALLRWQHPEKGLLLPGHFIPIIEETELTLAVGEWILHEAMRQMTAWLAQGISLSVSVNVFALHLQRPDFVTRLRTILQSYPDVAPESLELEILETSAFEDLANIIEKIRLCSAMAVEFSLDDFGTGYSSLTYLRRLPASVVKIDRSFVNGMLDNKKDQALVKGLIAMAHSLQRKVVAEGVETIAQGTALLRCGCDFGQGFGIGRPMPADAIPIWLSGWTIPKEWQEVTKSEELHLG